MTTERDDNDLQDPRLSARYRELSREEPSAQLDAAILGAAQARVAALRGGLRRWGVPLSLAAVVVLSVLVTTHMQEEAPDFEPIERPMSPPVEKPAEPPAAPQKEAKPVPQRAKEPASPAPRREIAREAPPAAAPSVEQGAASRAAPAAAPAALRDRGERSVQDETPEGWLERIVRLRSEGRHAEADASLAEFRRRYPDYRIPEDMRAKVLPR